MKAAVTERFVIDASITLAWCLPDETAASTDAILDRLTNGGEAAVPAIWPFEVANALLAAERRQRISLAQVTAVSQRIAALPITVDAVQLNRCFGPVLSAARSEGLTGYDAAYLELALREGFPLATLDKKLRNAAQNVGIALLIA